VSSNAAPACPKCEILEEKIDELIRFLRTLRVSFPTGDFCRAADGCPRDVRWQTHPDTCPTRLLMRLAGEAA
jgi:hypothetical protein